MLAVGEFRPAKQLRAAVAGNHPRARALEARPLLRQFGGPMRVRTGDYAVEPTPNTET
jgi:hypothetical protein